MAMADVQNVIVRNGLVDNPLDASELNDEADIELMRKRINEMEEEAEKLKQMQSEVDKQMQMPSTSGSCMRLSSRTGD